MTIIASYILWGMVVLFSGVLAFIVIKTVQNESDNKINIIDYVNDTYGPLVVVQVAREDNSDKLKYVVLLEVDTSKYRYLTSKEYNLDTLSDYMIKGFDLKTRELYIKKR